MNSNSDKELKSVIEKYKHIDYSRIFTFGQMISPYKEYCENSKNFILFFGIKGLDNLIESVRAGEVCTIISPTNTGKTSLLMQVIRHQTLTNSFLKNKLLINFTAELNEVDLIERQIQTELNMSSFELSKLQKGNEFYSNLESVFSKYDNIINVINSIKINEIIPYCKGLSEIKGKELGAIIIDYLQLIQSSKANEYERLSENMRVIKEIAQSLNVPVLLTSQISRQAFKNGEMDLTSGKGSGSIEESSQILLSLERVKETNHIDQKTVAEINEGKYQLMRIKVLKKKRGRFGSVLLLFNNRSLIFKEYVKPII